MNEPLTLHASAMDRIAACPGSAWPARIPLNVTTRESKNGTATHEVTKNFPSLPVAASTDECLEMLAPEVSRAAIRHNADFAETTSLTRWAVGLWRDWREWFPHPQTEQEYEVIHVQGEYVKLSGRCDLLSTLAGPDGSVYEIHIGDWKTGHKDDVGAHTEQLKAYGYLAAQRYQTARRVRVCVLWVRSGNVDWAEYRVEDLIDWFTERRRELRRGPRYNPGKHCDYCPRALECPAFEADARRAVRVLSGLHPSIPAESIDELLPLPPDGPERGHALAKLLHDARLIARQAERALDLIAADLDARGGSLPTGDGYELRRQAVERQKVLTDPGLDVLVDQGFLTTEQVLSCMTISKTALEKKIRDDAGHGHKRTAVEAMREALAAAGALRTDVHYETVLRPVNQLENEAHEQPT
jgi:PD-(D/E)XK nuclease superfamily